MKDVVHAIEDTPKPLGGRNIAGEDFEPPLARVRAVKLEQAVFVVVERPQLRDTQQKQLTHKLPTDAAGRACDGDGPVPSRFMGVQPETCSYDLAAAIYRNIDWDGITLADIQAQVLLSDRCTTGSNVENYAALVTAIADDIRKAAHPPAITAQLSFRDTPPERMILAIHRLRGIVDGFYVAYPSNVGPPCRYCSPGNLDQVLRAIRSG
jgi:hypothetical protein